MHYLYKKGPLVFGILLAMGSCKNASKKEAGEDKAQAVGTPVTITAVSEQALTEYVELNATSTFLQKSYVKSNVNGYIQSVSTAPGKYVNSGTILFTLKTKEAKSIGNDINKLDPSFRFSGTNSIKSSASGYITQLNHQAGDYVQDGEQLAVISDESSFAFLLNLPFELRQYMANNSAVDLTLPDSSVVKGTVAGSMPSVDQSSQTQSVVIKVPNSKAIPENLIAKVKIVKVKKTNSQSLPKAAVLTNDLQSDFWVMQMVDSGTAVKVQVKKGIETKDRVEILEPKFSKDDKILLTGNYGLPDTAKVIVKQ